MIGNLIVYSVLGNYGGFPFSSHQAAPAVTAANQVGSIGLQQANQATTSTTHASHATTHVTASTAQAGHLTYTTQPTQQQPEQLTSYLQVINIWFIIILIRCIKPAHGQIGTQTALLTLPNGYQ